MTVADKILFTCTACAYKARIPNHYSGRSIHCPKCKTVQEVGAMTVADSSSTAAEDAPEIAAPTSPAPGQGKIVFTCPACTYKGRLAAEYQGKTIRCPGCQSAQVVDGEPVVSPIVASFAADENAFRPGESEKIRFECTSCGYRAKIPSKYAGKPIHCPQCKEIQNVKAETDMEASTGRTVTLARISPAKVREPKLAMTNVGIQFECTVCGYASKISPSCAGDAIYCPSCRSPQKVEWSDPDEEEILAEDAAHDMARNAAETVAAPAIREDSSEPALPVAPASATALSLNIGAPAAKAAPVTKAAPINPPPAGLFGDDDAAVADAAALPAMALTDDSDAPGADDEESAETAQVSSAPAAAPIPAAARASSLQRARRSVRADADADSAEVAEASAAPAARARAEPAAKPARPVTSAPVPSRMPLVILGIVALALAGAAGWLFMERNRLSSDVADTNSALTTQKLATTTAESAHAAMTTERDTEKSRADAEKVRADAAEETVVERAVKIEALTADVAANEAKITALNAEITRLKAELEAAAQAAADAKGDAKGDAKSLKNP